MNGMLDFFYYTAYSAHSYVDFHSHGCYELVYYVTGTGTMRLDGTTLRYAPGSLTLTKPNYMHDERHEQPTEVIYFGFHYDDLPAELPHGLYRDADGGEIFGLIAKMKEELLSRKPHYAALSDLLLNEIILLLARQTQAAPAVHRPEKLVYARRFIDENCTQPINLHTLAEISGYSDDHFRHLFKEQTGLSPLNYILHKRLAKARQRLLHTDASVSVIGLDCGFSTTSQFIELFKRVHGKTPLQYRLSRGD